MGGEEDGAACVAELPHHALEQMGGLGVKTHKGLIHDDETGLVEPCGDDGQLLLHAVGVGGDGLSQIVRQFEAGGVVVDALPAHLSADVEDVSDEVEIPDAGHVVVQVGVIGDIGQLPLAGDGVGADGSAADGDLPGVELQDAHHAAEGGGLTGAVVADEAVNFAGGDVQGQIVHRLFSAVGLSQMLDVQHNNGPHSPQRWIEMIGIRCSV